MSRPTIEEIHDLIVHRLSDMAVGNPMEAQTHSEQSVPADVLLGASRRMEAQVLLGQHYARCADNPAPVLDALSSRDEHRAIAERYAEVGIAIEESTASVVTLGWNRE